MIVQDDYTCIDGVVKRMRLMYVQPGVLLTHDVMDDTFCDQLSPSCTRKSSLVIQHANKFMCNRTSHLRVKYSSCRTSQTHSTDMVSAFFFLLQCAPTTLKILEFLFLHIEIYSNNRMLL